MNQHISSSRTVGLGQVQPPTPGHRTIFCNDRQANLPIWFKGTVKVANGHGCLGGVVLQDLEERHSKVLIVWRRTDVQWPNLGALTVEEINEFSATSSPNKSPSWSLDEMPIIGTVGTAEMLPLALLRILAQPLPLEEFQTQEV